LTAIEPAVNFASAELFFGIAWDPEYLDARAEKGEPSVLGLAAGDDEGAWWKTLLLGQGHVDPWMSAPLPPTPEAIIRVPDPAEDQAIQEAYLAEFRTWRDDHEVEIDTWRRAARLIQDDYGVDVGWHGSTIGGGTRYPHLFVVGSIQSTSQWEPKPVNTEMLEPGESWVGRLERFVDDLQIDVSGAVARGWLLTANLA